MTDMSGHGRPQQDSDQLRHALTIHEVSARLLAAGVPRSERSIKRYCETGFLDAKKVPGPTGEQWFVAPAALPKLIGDLQQWQMQRLHSALAALGRSLDRGRMSWLTRLLLGSPTVRLPEKAIWSRYLPGLPFRTDVLAARLRHLPLGGPHAERPKSL